MTKKSPSAILCVLSERAAAAVHTYRNIEWVKLNIRHREERREKRKRGAGEKIVHMLKHTHARGERRDSIIQHVGCVGGGKWKWRFTPFISYLPSNEN